MKVLATLTLAVALMTASGSAAHAQDKNTSTSTNTQNQGERVIVNEGDTLSGIASRFQTTYVRLSDANSGIANPSLIYPGNSLTIPGLDDQLPSRPMPEQLTSADSNGQAPASCRV